ncbi:hypothetical protein MIND_00307900 [Mycena indigotica]|uniref:Uncharacterized protein n=1 Tax=Mycena indigotica TaxID=2126181 RepID=A0A8H6T339_9AGAR|nr:uncharacterized protein MIND_00307900 [Mycena indigotica]KAF7309371.1 hypothetical protein MIND_00307900 [Mycena indigotica]
MHAPYLYPYPHSYSPSPLASTSTGSDMGSLTKLPLGNLTLVDKPPAVRVIQLVEMPAPPRTRALPPSSASVSSTSSGLYTESEEDQLEDEYCSSAPDGNDHDMEAEMVEEESIKVDRILAWRTTTTAEPTGTTFTVTAPSPTVVLPPTQLRKRAASSRSSVSEESTPASKRSRTSGSSPSVKTNLQPAINPPTPTSTLLAPPVSLSRRHTSPRHTVSLYPQPPAHQRSTSLVDTRSDRHCSACDRRFASARAFRVHALHPSMLIDGDVDEETQRLACEAAVSYALEACARSQP